MDLTGICNRCEDYGYEPHPYVILLYEASLLIEAGFPATSEMYDMDFWLDLGLFRRIVNQRNRLV
jgi:hypothetical protein